MKLQDDVEDLLEELLEQEGTAKTKRLLKSLILDSTEPVLTIIANQASHRIPEKYLRGELYIASKGNLDFSKKSAVERQYKKIVQDLSAKLAEKNWKRIYLIPTGHVTLSLQLKSAVYRVTRLNTIDLFYSDGKFFDVLIDQRKLVN